MALPLGKFRSQRQSHIREMPRYRAVLSDIRLLTRRDRTRWLGRQDSNLRIRKSSAYHYRATQGAAAARDTNS